MKNSILSGLIPMFGLLLLPAAHAAAVVQPVVVQGQAQVAAKPAVQQRAKKKTPRRYSKATRSALRAMGGTAQGLPRAAYKGVQPLPETPSAVSQLQVFKLRPADVLASRTEAVAEPPVSLLSEMKADAGTLGDEPVSVIDQIRDKPKAQPIVNGPLRLRLHDQGLRASVQIPLTLK